MKLSDNSFIHIRFKNDKNFTFTGDRVNKLKLRKNENNNRFSCNIIFDTKNCQYFLDYRNPNIRIPINRLVNRSSLSEVGYIGEDGAYMHTDVFKSEVKEDDGIIDVSFEVRNKDVNRFSKVFENMSKLLNQKEGD